jgi:hypothetical protein
MAVVGVIVLAVALVVLWSVARTLVEFASVGEESDEVPPAESPSAPLTTTSGAPPTSEPPACDDLAEQYLDTFFALGAGTPQDPDATTVRLPIPALRAVDQQAADAGCRDFADVACSAYAELETQGLEAVNGRPPAAC